VPYTSALSDFLFSAVVYKIQNLYFFSDLRRLAEKLKCSEAGSATIKRWSLSICLSVRPSVCPVKR